MEGHDGGRRQRDENSVRVTNLSGVKPCHNVRVCYSHQLHAFWAEAHQYNNSVNSSCVCVLTHDEYQPTSHHNSA
jgi:hypothetical protein